MDDLRDREGARGERAEAGLPVRDPAATQQREQTAECVVREAPGGRHALRTPLEPGTEDIVRLASLDRREQHRCLARVVLTVGVEVDNRAGLEAAGSLQPSAHRRAEAAPADVGDDDGAGRLRDGGGAVRRAVVHHHDTPPLDAGPRDRVEDAREVLLLVAGRDDEYDRAVGGGR